MNKAVIAILAVLAVVVVVVAVRNKSESANNGGGTASTTQSSSGGNYTIAVIPKGTTHAYWKSVEAGARAAEKDFGVKVIYKGPLQEDDRTGQISLVQQFVADNVSGIVLAPLDDTALLSPVQSAMQKKIPVIIIDSALKGQVGTDFVSYVGTDNVVGGKMAGDEMTKILGGKGKLVLLRYLEGSASTSMREQGFLDSVKQSPGFSMLVDNRYGGASVSEAQSTSMALLDQIKQADGIFCPNESSTLGMLYALRQNNLAGKIHFVGFDATPPLVEALKNGEIDALVSQDPTKMGYEGVKACVDKLQGKVVPPNIDSGVQLITRDNLNTPAVQKLLNP